MAGWGSTPWGSGSWGVGSDPPLNLGFEIPDSDPGIPEGWSLVAVATAVQYLQFEGGATVEPFDWGGAFLDDGLTDLLFSTTDVEDFDSWVPSGFVESPPLTSIQFVGPKNVEDFEDLWFGNNFFKEDFLGVGTDLTEILFNGPSTVEDFETGWDNAGFKTDFVGVGTDLTEILFYDGTRNVEDFEDTRRDLEMFVIDPLNNIIDTVAVHNLSVNDRVFFVNANGSLPSPLLEDPTPFYVFQVTSGSSLRVKYTPGALTSVDILDHGTGSHALRYDPDLFWIQFLD